MSLIIPRSYCRIVERFGKPVRVQREGLAFYLPILESIKEVPENWHGKASKNNKLIQLTEQITDTKARECITEDNTKVLINSVIRWRIIDPIKAVYDVEDLPISFENAVLNTLRSEIGKISLDTLLSARRALTERIIANLAETCARWGIQVITLEIQELTTDKETTSAMLQQMEAERRSRATKSQAEGSAAAMKVTAEAAKTAAISKAHGIRESLKIISQAEKDYLTTLGSVVGYEAATKLLMAAKILEGYQTIAASPSSKVYIPNSINGIINFDNDTCFANAGAPAPASAPTPSYAAHGSVSMPAQGSVSMPAHGSVSMPAHGSVSMPAHGSASAPAPSSASAPVPTQPSANTATNSTTGAFS